VKPGQTAILKPLKSAATSKTMGSVVSRNENAVSDALNNLIGSLKDLEDDII